VLLDVDRQGVGDRDVSRLTIRTTL
jgi:hypothetical protein